MEGREELTEDQLCAKLASAFHSLPFDRDEWLGKVQGMYNRMLGASLEKTQLPDHPAYIAVHKRFGEYLGLRYRDFGSPPVGFALLKRAAKTPREVDDVARALKAMDLVDSNLSNGLRLLIRADLNGHEARKLAMR